MLRRVLTATILVMVAAALAGCAPGPNQLADIPRPDEDVAGFWLGLWHGFIMLFTFLISLFEDGVHVYEVHNNGAWYNLGFVLGACVFFGGGGRQAGGGNQNEPTEEETP